MADDYEKQLADWMARNGVGREVIAGSPEHLNREAMALRVADKKRKGDDYCVLCGKGPQPISGMELITRHDDPYIQPKDGDKDEFGNADTSVRACPKCWGVAYGDQDELSDD